MGTMTGLSYVLHGHIEKRANVLDMKESSSDGAGSTRIFDECRKTENET